jgi:hypothetical protein
MADSPDPGAAASFLTKLVLRGAGALAEND